MGCWLLCGRCRQNWSIYSLTNSFSLLLHCRCSIPINHQTGSSCIVTQDNLLMFKFYTATSVDHSYTQNNPYPNQRHHWCMGETAFILISRRILQTWKNSRYKWPEESTSLTQKQFQIFVQFSFLGGSGVAVFSKGLYWEGVIQASLLSAGEGSSGKALEVPWEEGNKKRPVTGRPAVT